jgi:hypothetical protein
MASAVAAAENLGLGGRTKPLAYCVADIEEGWVLGTAAEAFEDMVAYLQQPSLRDKSFEEAAHIVVEMHFPDKDSA